MANITIGLLKINKLHAQLKLLEMKHFATVLLSFFALNLFSQELMFQNEFEEQAFKKVEIGMRDNLMLLVGASGDASEAQYEQIKKSIAEVVEGLNPERFAKYSSSKKVKKIFEAVQKELLKKYQLQNQFVDVFETGSFNCVSATALYALMLEQFEIPYEIVETPGHVYLVATPGDERLVMESTDPLGGYLQLNEKLVRNQLNSLVAMKVITVEEMNSPDLDKILEELYPSEYIGLNQLVALQYYNQAIYDFEDGNFIASRDNAVRANYLNPDPRFDAMVYSALIQELGKREYNNPDYPKYFKEFSMLDTTEEHALLVTDEYRIMAYECLFNMDNPGPVEEVVDRLEGSTYMDRYGDEIIFIRSVLTCNYLIKKGEFNESWPYALSAMDVHPEDLDAISQFSAVMGYKMSTGHYPQPLDSMRVYMVRYPQLKDNKLWLSAYGNALIEHIYQELGADYTGNVAKEVVEFEALMEAEPDLGVLHNNIGVAYTRLALKHFNTSKSRALSTIESGLKYAPGNKDLLRVKQLIR